jgi:conjugative relaxase-like TrwC/TraI family protein
VVSWAKLGAERVDYYEAGVATGREDYYGGHGEAQGRYLGAGAEALGLTGELRKGELTRLAGGAHPASGERLRTTPGVTVGAFDFTFSAPKSVSLLYASGDAHLSSLMLEAHERAVSASIRVLEREAAFVRRGKGGLVRHRADGIVAACYRHRTSRAGDPQLHTHAIVANMARGPDGRWTALDSVRLRDFKLALGAIYSAELRANLAELGLTWQALNSKGLAELEGVDPAVLRRFSTRRAEIERAARGSTAAAMAGAAVDTRKGKRQVDMPSIERQVAVALGPQLLAELTARVAVRDGRPKPLVDGDRLAGPDGLTRTANTFDRRDVIVAIGRGAAQGIHAEALIGEADRFLARGDVIELLGDRYTTRDLLDAERARQTAQLGRANTRVAVAFEKALRDGVRGLTLTLEQGAVVEGVFRSGNGVDVVEAQAGTGKTYTMAAVRRVAEADGRQVIGCAPTARAGRELQQQAGIESTTLDSLVRRLNRGELQLTGRDVVVLDEAGMAGTRLAARLEEHAAAAGCKVIEVGDRRQLRSVLAGGELRGVHEQLGGLQLTDVIRQRDHHERRALGRLHAGDVEAYCGFAEKRERLHWHASVKDAVAAYMGHTAEVGFDRVAFITPTNAMAQAANDLVRERLGRVDPLEPGDRVVCRLNDRHLQVVNGDRGTVTRLHGAGVDVQLDTGVTRSLPRSYLADGHLQHGYAQTIHTAQGATVDRTVVATWPDEFYAELAYVATTRARDRTDVYVVDGQIRDQERAEIGPTSADCARDQRDELVRAMKTSRADALAIDQLPARQLDRGLELDL